MDFILHAEPLLKGFWFVALPVSVIFVIQAILTFLGMDSSDGLEADFDGDFHGAEAPFQLFSLRNAINFLLGFSWTGISFYMTVENKIILLGLSFTIGVLFVYLFFIIIRQIQKLSENNSFDINSTIDRTGEVYLTIPENKTGKGKVLISVKGSYHELDAVTDNGTIPSGSIVKVIKVESNNLLKVELV